MELSDLPILSETDILKKKLSHVTQYLERFGVKIGMMKLHVDAVLEELKAEAAPSFTYKIAKKSPFPNSSVTRITSAYGTTEFLPALQTFLNDHLPHNTLKPNQFDRFDIYNTISILLPSKPHISDTKHLISVRATAKHSNGLQKPSTLACFDTVVVVEDEEVYEEGQIAGTWCMFYCISCSKFRFFF